MSTAAAAAGRRRPPTRIGVAGLGVALGDPQSVAETVRDYVDDEERVLQWGYHTYHRSPQGVRPRDLAARAASHALSEAGVDADDVDLVVVANSDVPEYLQWDVSSAVARELGLHTTRTLLLAQGCSSAVTAFEYVAGLFAVREDLDVVLIVALNQTSEAHTNRMRFNTCLASDGAAAAVVRRDHPRLRWLATEQVTDPTCVDFFRLEYGGSAAPCLPAGVVQADLDPLDLVYDHFKKDPFHLAEFREALTSRVALTVHRACARAGVPVETLARFVYLHDNQPSMTAVAQAVGVTMDRTNADLAAAIGHCGAADHLISLATLRDRGELASGDVVALAGLSVGMHWFCTLLVA